MYPQTNHKDNTEISQSTEDKDPKKGNLPFVVPCEKQGFARKCVYSFCENVNLI